MIDKDKTNEPGKDGVDEIDMFDVDDNSANLKLPDRKVVPGHNMSFYSTADKDDLRLLSVEIEVSAQGLLEKSDNLQMRVYCESRRVNVDKYVIEPLIEHLAKGKKLMRCTPENWSLPQSGSFLYLEIDAARIINQIDGIPDVIKKTQELYDWLRLDESDDPYLVHIKNAGELRVDIRRFGSYMPDGPRRAFVLSGILGDNGWNNILPGIQDKYDVFGLSDPIESKWT